MNKVEKRVSILVVDDSPLVLGFLSNIFTEQGYELRTIKSGKEVLPSVQSRLPDLILLDIDIPDLNGLDVCRLIKEDVLAKEVPVIFLSGFEESEKKLKAFEVGGVDYITKPFVAAELLTRVRTHLNLSQARAQLEKQKIELLLNNEILEKEIAQHKQAVTEKEVALQSLKRKDEQYKLLIDNAREAIMVAQDGMIRFFNFSTLSLTGYSDEELKSKPFLEFIYPEDRDMVLANYKKRIKGDLVVSKYSFRLVMISGIIRWVEISAVLIIWEGRPATLNFLSDITDRKLAEDTLREERSGLEKTVEARTTELRESLQELTSVNLRLEETGRFKSRFLTSMSHELRTPLNAVLGFSELLGKGSFGALNDKQISYVRQIESAGKNLLSLIADLLDLSRIDAGNMILDLSTVNPWEFIGTITEMMGMQSRKKELKVNIDISPDGGYVCADLKKCKQIMINILSNAIKYTPVLGSISIRTSKDKDNMLKVEVSDTGIGIRKEDCQKLFTDFYQIDRARDEQLGGAGIGLALSRRLVELQGGKIGIESEMGKGTTIWFTLPLESATVKNVQPPEKEKSQMSNILGKKILVAEDDERNLMLITEVLNLWDHQVIVAKNGQEAIDLFSSAAPDLILMDLRMPVKGGMEATAAIRDIERSRSVAGVSGAGHIPIIALTASVNPDTKQSVLKAGFDMYLSKPVSIAAIEDTLKNFLTKDA